MAQIVTITNPLTGQPAQVDQLDHTAQQIDDAIARALPGGSIDTLLAEKAPAGYGLGTNAVTPPNNSLDDAVKNGWYLCAPSFNGAPTGHNLIGYGTVFVIERASDCCIQVYWSEATSNIAGSPLNLVRKYDGTTWSQWEWVNPPMAPGVEYRTTERHMGKPVYVKLVDFGALPNATAKAVNFSIENNAQLLECKGFVSGGGVLPYSYPGSSVGTANVFTNKSSGSFGVIVSTDKDLSGKSAYFILKYTKTTD